MTQPSEIEKLREQVLTEFKQVFRLAPEDYTENCTNVVMSIIAQSEKRAEIRGRIDEGKYYSKNIHKNVGSPRNIEIYENYIPAIVENMVDDRIAQLESELKTLEGETKSWSE